MINAPDSPTLGQSFTSGGATWTWDGTKWVGATSASIAISDTPPVAPPVGTWWWSSAEAQLYIYYDDGTSKQWMPASNQPGPQGPIGSTGPQGVAGAPQGGQCRLIYTDATHLTLVPYNGNLIQIAGALYPIPAAGISVTNAGLTAFNLAYVYIWNNAGTLTLEISTSPFVTDNTPGNIGIRYKAGDTSRSLVGMVEPLASSQFFDSPSNRMVASWFNRRNRSLSGASTGGSAVAAAAYTEINTAARVAFLSWNEEAVSLDCSGGGYPNTANQYQSLTMGFDGAVSSITTQSNFQYTSANLWTPMACSYSGEFALGYHYVTPTAYISAGNLTVMVSIQGTVSL